ncbi:MAG: type II secretion system protein GspM [Kiloniellales bacterium]
MHPVRGSPLSRLAALGLLILVVVAFAYGVGTPLLDRYQAKRAEIEESLQSLRVHRRAARRETALRRTIERLEESRPLDGLLLPSGSDGAAVAAMQERIQSIIADTGARLTSALALPVEPGQGHRRIGLRLQFEADIEGLQRILYALESGRPAVVLDNLFIRGRTSRAIGAVNPLDTRVDVLAFKPEDAQ